ncbi:hypothetical protein TruAng_005948 [Truncatella angustata]|nr:hypothetical protein TruAng_005948 [Truncatella angustata]
MVVCDGPTTSAQVIEAFASQIQGRTFLITGAGKPRIGSQMAIALARGYRDTTICGPPRTISLDESSGAGAAADARIGAHAVNLTSGVDFISPVVGLCQAQTVNILFSFALSGYNGDTELGAHLNWDDYGETEPIAKRNTGKDFVWEHPRFKTFEQIAAASLVAALILISQLSHQPT